MSQRAYQLAISQRSPSISAIAASCLQAKKVKWEHAERERVLRESALLRVTCEAVMQGGGDDEEKVDRCRRLEDVFGRAEAVRLQKRTVPDYLIDNITFGVMWDPVIVWSPSSISPEDRGKADVCVWVDDPWPLLRSLNIDRPPEAQSDGPADARATEGERPAAEPCAASCERGVPQGERLGCRLVES